MVGSNYLHTCLVSSVNDRFYNIIACKCFYIYKINTEEEQELAAAFGIRSIPTLLFIPMEGKPQMAQGALPKASLKEAIDKVMLGK